MALPKAQLTVNKEIAKITYDIPCPCGFNSLFNGFFVLGKGDYHALGLPEQCYSCKRECTSGTIVQDDGLQKLIKFEYNYTDLSGPAYWAAYEGLQSGCEVWIGKERVKLPQRMPDKQIIESTTFSCWWENRLGLVPTLVFQQNFPTGD